MENEKELSSQHSHSIDTSYSSIDETSLEEDASLENHENIISNEIPDELLSKYQIIQEIGKGAQGHVYHAIRISDSKHVAIKQIQINSVQNWKDYDLFKRESDVLQSIDLPGIATFYESCEFLEQKMPSAYIIQEYIEGQSLADMLKANYRFSLPQVFKITLQLIDLLEKLHTHEPRVIHRDIKPSNIMLKPLPGGKFQVYLIDFGAVANPQIQGGGSTVAGTYGYMPPEQLTGNPCPASDMYSLGATLAYMLSGVEPCLMNVQDFRLIIDPHLENIPRPVIRVLQEMLEPSIDARLCDYNKLRESFEAFSKEIYQIDSVFYSSLDKMNDQDFNANLETVEYYGESGNIDLWMQLDENTPRQNIPKTYRKLTIQKPDSYIFIFKFLIFLMIMAFILLNNIFFVILAVLIFILFIIYTHTSKKQKSDLQKLLIQGRKSIATVTKIQLLSTPTLDIKCTDYTNYNVSTPAKYKVMYKFNPPDDTSPYDLIHEVVTHYDLSKKLQPGSPLPILYYVNPNVPTEVLSMPFPIPYKDIDLKELDDIYYKS